MKNKIIAIDIDLTIVPSDKGWLEWLKNSSKVFYEESYFYDMLNNQVKYYLPSYFELYEGVEAMDYWAENRTYPSLPLLPDAYRVIKELYQVGYEIVFVSFCMDCKTQFENKLKFLQKRFDFLLPDDLTFIPAKKKHYIRADYIIDDRNSFLQPQPEEVKLIKMETPYTQCVELTREHTSISNWCEIEEYFVNELEKEG
ncbi:putative 5' nucleotidase [Vibrio phage 277E43-1]|nr:putative 5' nucleotidase [Vibrio phage 277E43-1]